jgi:hypothetical protein
VPVYGWLVEEIAADGSALPAGERRQTSPGEFVPDPEDAYWTAVDSLCTIQE